MSAWEELSPNESKMIWRAFKRRFAFQVTTDPKGWPGIKESTPSVTYQISSIYGHQRPRAETPLNPVEAARYRVWEKDLNIKTLRALRKCIPAGETIYALNWEHACYWFNPHDKTFTGADYKEWRVPVLPNGDAFIFYKKELGLGLFGHPWEQTICVFGQPLLRAFAESMPLLFHSPVRKNGRPFSE